MDAIIFLTELQDNRIVWGNVVAARVQSNNLEIRIFRLQGLKNRLVLGPGPAVY